jgi:hypothetical protein
MKRGCVYILKMEKRTDDKSEMERIEVLDELDDWMMDDMEFDFDFQIIEN